VQCIYGIDPSTNALVWVSSALSQVCVFDSDIVDYSLLDALLEEKYFYR
jgi:hypothetical protein